MAYRVTKEEAVRALETVRDALRDGTISEREFDMSNGIVLSGSSPTCGTAGCIGGHAARIIDPRSWSQPHDVGVPSVWTIMDKIRDVLPGAYGLFFEFAKGDSEEKMTRDQAADAIDRCLAGELDPWQTGWAL